MKKFNGRLGREKTPAGSGSARTRAAAGASSTSAFSFPGIASLLILLPCLGLLLAAAGCSARPFGGGGESGPSWRGLPPEGAVLGEIKPAGEDEFLKGEYAAARPLLTNAGRGGSLRAVYMLRVIVENGLDGTAPDPALASRFVALLAASKDVLQGLADRGPVADRPVYEAALAMLYLRGEAGVERNMALAAELARKSSDGGFGPARNLLAAILLSPLADSGRGGRSDAFELTSRMAAAGDALAMGNLSFLYRMGIGVDAEPFQASSWARAAADKTPNTPRVYNDLGVFYEEGRAVTQDLAEAARWYAAGAARGYQPARDNLARLRSGGRSGAPSFFTGIEY